MGETYARAKILLLSPKQRFVCRYWHISWKTNTGHQWIIRNTLNYTVEGHPGSIHILDNLDTSIPCVIGKTALVQEIRHRPTAMGVQVTSKPISFFLSWHQSSRKGNPHQMLDQLSNIRPCFLNSCPTSSSKTKGLMRVSLMKLAIMAPNLPDLKFFLLTSWLRSGGLLNI